MVTILQELRKQNKTLSTDVRRFLNSLSDRIKVILEQTHERSNNESRMQEVICNISYSTFIIIVRKEIDSNKLVYSPPGDKGIGSKSSQPLHSKDKLFQIILLHYFRTDSNYPWSKWNTHWSFIDWTINKIIQMICGPYE